jgi:hypothetical protein
MSGGLFIDAPVRRGCIPQSLCRTPSQSDVVQQNSSGPAAAPQPFSGSPAGSEQSRRRRARTGQSEYGISYKGKREPTST